MKTRSLSVSIKHYQLAILLAIWPMIGFAQVPVDDSGNPVGDYYEQGATSDDIDLALISPAELQDLVGSIALYPDDLLAIILPASTYPLQLVEASRFLENLKNDPSLQPDDDWDDSVVALINYPEIIELLNADLDWTWQLGEAVVAQQADVISAIETFRDRAYAAGNLKSDDYQDVTNDDGVIEITPVDEEIIYVPYYEPERVVVYQPQPVYYYHPQPYPVYYYPYAYGHSFHNGYFWGVTTAFTIGWATDYLHVYHHSYSGHPYYGYTYNNNWWYRRPTISVYNTYYANNHRSRSNNYYRNGDQWRSNNSQRLGPSGRQVSRTRYQPSSNRTARSSTSSSFAPSSSAAKRSGSGSSDTSDRNLRNAARTSTARTSTKRGTLDSGGIGKNTLRQQPAEATVQPRSGRSGAENEIRFRERKGQSSANRERQANTSTRSRLANTSAANTDTATARKSPGSKIRFESRTGQRQITTSRDTSNASPRTSSSQRNTAFSGKSSATTTRLSNQRNTTAVKRGSSTPVRSSSARTQAATRVQKTPAPRQQTQRQTAPTQQKSRSGSSKSGSGSSSNSKSESSSRSSKKSSAGNNNRSRRS